MNILRKKNIKKNKMKKLSEVATHNPGRPDIELKDPKNPLSAVGKWNEKPVYKYSYNPRSGRLIFSYPGENHADAISKAKDTNNFDEYIRVIYAPGTNVAGSRVWGASNYEESDPDADIKAFEAQYATFKVFKKFHPRLKWILNLTNDDLNKGVESLNLAKINKNRILEDRQMEELKKNLKVKTRL